jgi:hypothetical protein
MYEDGLSTIIYCFEDASFFTCLFFVKWLAEILHHEFSAKFAVQSPPKTGNKNRKILMFCLQVHSLISVAQC